MLLAVALLTGWVGQSLAISAVKQWSFKDMLLGNWGVIPNDGNILPPGYTPGYGGSGNPNKDQHAMPPSGPNASQPYTPQPVPQYT